MPSSPRPTTSCASDCRLLTALTVAVCDGLAMQHVADQTFDLEPVIRYWAGLIRHGLEQAREEAGEPAGDDS